MHEHIECEHELKYCKVCKVVYCGICNKQWYSYEITVATPYVISPYISYNTNETVIQEADPNIECIHNG